MMGIQATAGKRKLDAVVASSGVAASNCEESAIIPAKTGRWATTSSDTSTTASTTPVLPATVITTSTSSNTSSNTISVLTTSSILSTPSSDDCIARLRAVAVPGETPNSNWHSGGGATPTISSTIPSSLATTLLSDDLDDEDLDDYDDFSDEDRCGDTPYPTTLPQGYQPASRYPDFSQYQSQRQQGYNYHTDDPFQTQYLNRTSPSNHRNAPPPYWNNYYAQPQPQQTIRCDENGKSYLELGSAPPPIPQPRPPPPPIRCCDGPTRWCNYPCYRQRRLAVLNLSMFKLARYRQCSDPSLHRSVLICNTLRLIEREMEAEGNQIAAYQAQQQQAAQAQQHQQQIAAESIYSVNTSPLSLNEYSNNNRLTPVMEPMSYEHNLRELNASGRATPFPTQSTDADSGLGDEDTSRSINWSSVLSLTSQTDLDPLNNNELYQSVETTSSTLDPCNSVDMSSANEIIDTNNSTSSSQLMDEFLPTWNKTSSSSSCSVDDSLRTEQYNNNRFPGEGEWDSFMQVLVGGS